MQTIHDVITYAARHYGIADAEAADYIAHFRALGERIGVPVPEHVFTDDDAEIIMEFIERCMNPGAHPILDQLFLAGQAVQDARAAAARAEEERDQLIRRARRLGHTMNAISSSTPGLSISRVQQILSC